MISTASYSYKDNIDEAINKLKKIKLQNNGEYLLLFTVQHDHSEETPVEMVSIKNFIDTFPEKATLYWNLFESSDKHVTLFTSISI